jgi:hypothetical protein
MERVTIIRKSIGSNQPIQSHPVGYFDRNSVLPFNNTAMEEDKQTEEFDNIFSDRP